MSEAQAALPRWNMSTIYPGLDSPEFMAGFQAAVTAVDDLGRLFDDHGVGLDGHPATTGATVVESILDTYNQVLAQTRTLYTYIYSFVATDSRHDQAQAALSEIEQVFVRLNVLATRFTAWAGTLDVDALAAQSPAVAAHAYVLRKEQERARHLMSSAEETLAAELAVTGGSAWSRLYANVTSQLMVDVESPDGPVELPMSAVRNLAYDADRGVRRRAFEAELAAWQAASVPIAAALNSIKGEANTLSTRRGWASPLDQALSSNNIDHQTLDAMLAAMREAFPEFRRYLRAKARLLDLPVLAWYDLFAPVGGDGDVWPFEDAMAFVSEHFGAFSPRLSALARRASSESWIDAEPRPGKEDGAFCVDLRADESRVLLNYQPAFVHVSILAHELGHAYHNLNLAGRTMLQRATPMTLAETASIFCETIIRHAAFGGAGLQGQLAILETSLQNACVVVVDIASRFLFEQQVFERRRRRELSVDELCAMMRDAQLATYGDALDAGTLHPFMWAAKSHYYDATFYNYPYAFGLLFGLGLYAIYQRESEGFQERYDRLLASTGLGDAAQLAAEFGIDIQTPEFWRTSLGVITADIDRFEHLITALYQQPTM